MLHLIAAQHLRGRRPFVVTTNIDAGWRVERAQAVDDLYDMATAAGFRPSLTGN